MYTAKVAISKRINFIMFDLGINQNQLAKMINITQPAISKYLKGRIPPPFVLLHLAKLSGKSIEWILTGENDINAPAKKVSENPDTFGEKKTLEEKLKMLPVNIKKNIENLIDLILEN